MRSRGKQCGMPPAGQHSQTTRNGSLPNVNAAAVLTNKTAPPRYGDFPTRFDGQMAQLDGRERALLLYRSDAFIGTTACPMGWDAHDIHLINCFLSVFASLSFRP
jgi:hypothetical protein